MRRLLLAVLAGLLLGGIVHVGTILLLPALARRDTATLFAGLGSPGSFHVLAAPTPGAEPLPLADPEMALAVCQFSLAARPAHIKANLPKGFWSVSVYDRSGNSLFSLNDHTAERDDLDVLLATTAEIAALRSNPPASIEQAIVTELPVDAGFVMLRAFVGSPSREAEVEAALGRSACAAPL